MIDKTKKVKNSFFMMHPFFYYKKVKQLLKRY